MTAMRLDKLLAHAGCGTRSEVKQFIRQGRVSVDGAVCKKADSKIDTGERVCVDGREVRYLAYEYYMLHKAAGCVSAVRDDRYPTVLDGICSPQKSDLFPVGRLDIDTEGLLLITNDGALAHRLLSPKNHVDKVYFARVAGKLCPADAEKFAAGMDIGDERPTRPARLQILRAEDGFSEAEVTIQEGRFHQVKRMFQALGKEVLYLKRMRMGALALDDSLPRGDFRPLTEEELRRLQEDKAYE